MGTSSMAGRTGYGSTSSGWSQSTASKKQNNVTKFKTFNFDKRGSKQYTKQTMPLSHFAGHNMWMLKATNLNRGRGIHVFRDLAHLKRLIEEYCKGMEKVEGSPTKGKKEKLQSIEDPPGEEGADEGKEAKDAALSCSPKKELLVEGAMDSHESSQKDLQHH